MKWMLQVGVIAFVWPAAASAAEPVPPASQRFAAADGEEVPSFRRHVLPLMGRLGCNGRACHGSFQGRGGFRLSLFGYDFKADHEALTSDEASSAEGPRVDLKDPLASLVLQKPTLVIDHEGGRRMQVDSWQYQILRRWVVGGAKGIADDEAEIVSLEIEPRELVFHNDGEQAQLHVVAVWTDGSKEDVTPLCRFRSNDEAIATIDEDGVVKIAGKGDTDVVVFYDNGVATVPTMRPVSDLIGPKYPQAAAPTKIDELIAAKLEKLGIVPSALCTDEEFLRRVSLDMSGSLPLPREITDFVADSSPDKRSKKVDELLSRPAYAAWWTTKLCDITGNNERNINDQQFRREMSEQWYQWIYKRVSENVPYDELIAGIVLATSRKPEQSFDDYAAEMSTYFHPDHPADFAERATLPHYWTRRQFNQPKDKALGFSYAFLGVRLQCAECHKHPFDQWTQQDFQQFTAFFNNVSFNYAPDARQRAKEMTEELGLGGKKNNKERQQRLKELLREGKSVPWREVFVAQGKAKPPKDKANKGKNNKQPAGRVITPKLLGGEEVVAEQYGDPREALMEWMRRGDNPYFARAMVNRVWSNYFNVGIVEPPDDMNLANPASNEALLDYLTQSFVAHGYDMKWLHREIAASAAYQRSWQPNETNRLDNRNFSHAVIRRLPAEVAYDALVQATAAEHKMQAVRDDLRERAIGVSSGKQYGRKGGGDYVLTLFGKPARATNCDCERSNEPSLLQTIFLRNDQTMLGLLDRNDGWLRQMAPPGGKGRQQLQAARDKAAQQLARLESRRKKFEEQDKAEQAEAMATEIDRAKERLAKVEEQLKNEEAANANSLASAAPEDLVREAYLRTVGRLPNDEEQGVAKQYLAESDSTASGMRDLLWALLNTKEFIVNR